MTYREKAMIVALSTTTNEAALSGTPQEYAELAAALERGQGRFALVTTENIAPYGVALETLSVEAVDTPTVRITVDRTALDLAIRGPVRHLATLSRIVLAGADSGDPKGHVHLEGFEGHDFLAEDSFSLTVHDAVDPA
ncbi:Imm32 family immunity protein [Saccharothrix violaceirubra]|uniref:Uncharacterized protein n=1 Tax=Saccharothrix violaceirubra TaxID=413306 RepID=A0A7W7SZ68_9PSEU|nr:hypothetical protein [Saccharothrix violaceirubra]MBB4963535.1 hypothetical protein [Saccharothrix violaceirubra]